MANEVWATQQINQNFFELSKDIRRLTKAIDGHSKSSNKLQLFITILTGIMAIGIIIGLFI